MNDEELKKILFEKIAEKFGEDVLDENYVTPVQKMSFLKQVKELKDKELSIYNDQELDLEQVELVKKIINKKNNHSNCPQCSKYHIYFDIKDDVSLERYSCCHQCYIDYIEGREERWESGWRPQKNE